MIHDLRTILEGWEFEPGKISVRKIIGRDGREKIQTRVDLGLLQLEAGGRPDGTRPMGHESYLEHCEHRLRTHQRRRGSDAGFRLSVEDCRELLYESHLYYQRYLSLFVLEDFDGVERDTSRNLRAIDLARLYAGAAREREAFLSQLAYVRMMNVRGRVYGAMQAMSYDTALELTDDGIRELESLDDESEAPAGERPELRVLHELRDEVIQRMPPDSPPRLRHELERAVAGEDYARAAKLRDLLAALDHAKPPRAPTAARRSRGRDGH
ncbi:MAG: UvrB/UvrC motif-containing protein [Phycisphaerae bacterium]